MKKIILIMCLIFLSVSNVFAGGFALSTNYEVTDTMAVIYKNAQENAGSAGLHVGTLFNYTTDSGLKVLGIGGAIIGVQSSDNSYTGALGLTIITLFNDAIQLGVNYSSQDDDKFHFMVGISSIKLVSSVGNTISSIAK